jgi:DNA sulfur modification protein DndD
MWIYKLELTDFKSYQHQVLNFPAPSEAGKNIILVGGMNGYGKTSLLQAIYLSLYGKEAITYLARAGLGDADSYHKFLEKALHRDALREYGSIMTVLIQFNTKKNHGFQVKRTWHFNHKGQYQRGSEHVELLRILDGHAEPLQSDSVGEILEQEFVPAHIAPFFFFDGEKINELATQNRPEQIKEGMESLLGIVFLKNLKQTLRRYQINASKNIEKIDEEKLLAQNQELRQKEALLKSLQKDKSKFERGLERLTLQRTELTNRIASLGGSTTVTDIKKLTDEQKRLEKQRDECQKNLDDLVITEIPFQLVGQELIDCYRQQISGEIKKLAWEAKNTDLKQNMDEFMRRFAKTQTPEIRPALTESQQESVRLRVEKVWQNLFSPLPKDCATEMIHHYVPAANRSKLLQRLKHIDSTNYDLIRLVKQRDLLDNQLEELKKRYAKIEDIAKDGRLESLKTALQKTQTDIDEKQKMFGKIEREITALKTAVNQLNATYKQQLAKFVQAQPMLSKVANAHQIEKLIDELIPKLYPLKQRQLTTAISDTYHKLSHKQQIAEVKIDDMGNVTRLSQDGTLIGVEQSAGENQIFATALLAGLANVSGLKAPLIVDTPLGRLDSVHRDNILNFWVSDKQRQVILLSQDKEIDVFYYHKFKNSIAKTYLLEHQELGHHFGKTVAIEDKYFFSEGVQGHKQ